MKQVGHAQQESAFTLIELVIALALLGLVFATIFPVLTNVSSRSSRAAATATATSDASFAARLFESDIEQARGTRSSGDNITTGTSVALNATAVQGHDIILASPSRLILNSDVLDLAGIERVSWELLSGSAAVCGGTSNSVWCFRRTIANSTGTLISSEIVTRGAGAVPSSTTCTNATLPTYTAGPRVFCYQQMVPNSYSYATWNETSCAGTWAPTEAVTRPNPNSGQLDAAVATGTGWIANIQDNPVDSPRRMHVLDRVAIVGATIYSGGEFARTSERSYENVTISLRAREGQAYREALMCGIRARWGS